MVERVSCPLNVPVAVGLKWIVNTIDWPDFSVSGELPPLTEKPVPLTDSDWTITGAVPLDVSVTDLLIAVPTETFPKARKEALRVSAAVDGFNCRAMLLDNPFAAADIVAV